VSLQLPFKTVIIKCKYQLEDDQVFELCRVADV